LLPRTVPVTVILGFWLIVIVALALSPAADAVKVAVIVAAEIAAGAV
jgi:hypothetical protein